MDPEIKIITKDTDHQSGSKIWTTLVWILTALVALIPLTLALKKNFDPIRKPSSPFQKQITLSYNSTATANLRPPNIFKSGDKLEFGWSTLDKKFVGMLWVDDLARNWPNFDLTKIVPNPTNYLNLNNALTKQLLPYILPTNDLVKAKIKLPDQTELTELQLPANIQLKSKNNLKCSLNSVNLATLNSEQIAASPFLMATQKQLNLKISTLYVDKYGDNSLIFCGYLSSKQGFVARRNPASS